METLYAEYAYVGLALLAILMIGWLANLLVKRFLLGVVRSIAKKNQDQTERIPAGGKLLFSLSHLVSGFCDWGLV